MLVGFSSQICVCDSVDHPQLPPHPHPLIMCRYPFYWKISSSRRFFSAADELLRIKLNGTLFRVCVVVATPLSCRCCCVCAQHVQSLMEAFKRHLIDHMRDGNAISFFPSLKLFLLLMIYFDRIGFWCAVASSSFADKIRTKFLRDENLKFILSFFFFLLCLFRGNREWEKQLRAWLIYVMQFTLFCLSIASLSLSIYIYISWAARGN